MRSYSPCDQCEPQRCRPCPEYSSDEIVPALWVGGGKQIVDSGLIDVVLTLDPDVAIRNCFRGEREVVIPFADAETPPRELLEECAEVVDKAMLRGERILVRCHAGLNRSSFIVAYWLVTRGHMGSQEAITLVQERRARYAEYPLSNNAFVATLSSL